MKKIKKYYGIILAVWALFAFACQKNEMKGEEPEESKVDDRYCNCNALQSDLRASLLGVIHFNQELEAWYILGPVNDYTNPNVHLPCNLADSFKVEGLEVIISGISSFPHRDLSAFDEYGYYFCIKLLSVELYKPYFSEEILGKWELREIIDSEGVLKPYEPTGYVEYLKDSLLGWYDYETEEYTKVIGKYWVDSLAGGYTVPYWMLHYGDYDNEIPISTNYNNMGEFFWSHSTSLNCYFIDDDQMNLQTNDLLLWGENPIYIYKRIK